MALEDYKRNMEMCCRCSCCKFIPLERLEGYRYAHVCPSVARYNFHAYSGGGRIGMGVGMLERRFELSDTFLKVLYDCQMCGGCDVSCKYAMDMDVLDPINEMRIACVGSGRTLPVLDRLRDNLRKTGVMVGKRTGQGEWAAGLDVAEVTEKKTKVVYHAGCRARCDEEQWKVSRATLTLLKKAGVDVGIAREELCCGGRAYEMGYKEDFLTQAEKMMDQLRKSGAETLVTGCADCFHALSVLYDRFAMKGDMEVLHTTEYLNRLLKEGRIEPTRKVEVKVAYHDPCHLGRLGEPYVPWEGKEIPGHIRLFDPPKELRRGTHGVYEPPREILRSIPGIKLVEMERRKEYAWCCGAGGGVEESNPAFAAWTAKERMGEAISTGADALVTACSGCERSFRASAEKNGMPLKIFDVVELLEKAV